MLKNKERIYQTTIVFLIVVLFMVVHISNSNYYNLLCVNEQTHEALATVQEQKDALIDSWAEDYYTLTLEYEELVNEYEVLVEENEAYTTKSSLYCNVREYNLTQEEIYLLAQCVEAEAGCVGYTTDLEQQYTCQVILNRVVSEQFPNTVAEVIYQKRGNVPQFSVAYNGMMDKHSNVDTKTLANVYSVLTNGTDLPSYVLFFYDKSVSGNYVNTLNRYITIGRTVFAYDEVK